jgi:hypothetical protein
VLPCPLSGLSVLPAVAQLSFPTRKGDVGVAVSPKSCTGLLYTCSHTHLYACHGLRSSTTL